MSETVLRMGLSSGVHRFTLLQSVSHTYAYLPRIGKLLHDVLPQSGLRTLQLLLIRTYHTFGR